jgi:hypothetical protein
MTQIDYQNRHCIIDQKDKVTWDDRGGDGRTNFTLRIKEQATRLTLHKHDDDDDDDEIGYMKIKIFCSLFPSW